MHVASTLCFTLHSKPYLESSLLLDVYSREYGRLHLIAKGAKQKNMKLLIAAQPYQRLLMSWKGRNELMVLIDVEADNKPYDLPGIKLIAGSYINELLTRLLYKNDPDPKLFDFYDAAILALSNREDMQAILRVFEKNLLQCMGYGLVLDHDVTDGKTIEKGKKYYYILEQGPTKYAPTMCNYIEILGSSLFALDQELFQQEHACEEIKKLMRFILDQYLGSKPLNSRKLYKSYMRHLSA